MYVYIYIRTGMYALVRIKAGFLRKSFEAEVALEGAFSSMRAHVDFQVRLAAKCCVANLGAYATSLYLEGSPFHDYGEATRTFIEFSGFRDYYRYIILNNKY